MREERRRPPVPDQTPLALRTMTKLPHRVIPSTTSPSNMLPRRGRDWQQQRCDNRASAWGSPTNSQTSTTLFTKCRVTIDSQLDKKFFSGEPTPTSGVSSPNHRSIQYLQPGSGENVDHGRCFVLPSLCSRGTIPCDMRNAIAGGAGDFFLSV